MNIFETVLLNTILLIAPLLCYFIYVFFEKTLDKKKNDLFLDAALFTSFYLLIKFGSISTENIPILLIDIPLIIAYLKNRKVSIFALSVLISIYVIDVYKINTLFVISEYVLYFLIYHFKYRLKKLNFINLYLLFKIVGFYQYIYFSKIYIVSGYAKYCEFIIIVLFFYIVIKSLTNLFKEVDNISSLYSVTKNIADDKQTKESLFKITHEIKNPIAVCKGYLDMFNADNKEHAKKYIPIVKEEINRVLILLEDFLCINTVKIEKEIMDVSLLLEDIKNSFSFMLRDRNIKLIYNEIDDTYIEADYNRLKQVMVNLIKNSMESIEQDGMIKLSATKKNNKVKIIVEDNGTGMTEEELERIKEAFFTTKRNGTGLGIYLSNEIILKHQGNLKYHSKKNIGTIVTITLPT